MVFELPLCVGNGIGALFGRFGNNFSVSNQAEENKPMLVTQKRKTNGTFLLVDVQKFSNLLQIILQLVQSADK